MNTATSERIIPFAGGHNFRDMGGYPTADGRSVAWGRVFRSGTMAALSDDDHALLDSLKLRLIFDLRSTRERTLKPSRFPATADFEIWTRDHVTSAADVVEAVQRPETSAGHAHELMIDLYRGLAYEQSESYKVLFRRLADGDLPLVFHCSAGKDRTGTAAALLLDLLGVPREVIVADYALTDSFFEALRKMALKDPRSGTLASIDPVIWAPLMQAHPDYITTMLDTIAEKHGSTAGYMRDVLGMTDAEIARIRERLLV